MIDGGAEYCGYASDLTRTFTVGEWSLRQKAVYEAVSRVKQFAENTACPGVSFSEFEKKVRDNMNEEIIIL